MYCIQVNNEATPWIAAVFTDLEKGTEWFRTLDQVIQDSAEIKTLANLDFPFFMVENILDPSSSATYLEFLSLDQLIQKIKQTTKTEIENHTYFRYYFFDEEYFQLSKSDNYMKYIDYTDVDNDALNEDEYPSIFREKVKKTSQNYDLGNLDNLFEDLQSKPHSPKEAKELGELGYERLFWEMNYDFACSKLSDEEVYELVPMVEKMELLLNKKLWEHRAFAYSTELETSFLKEEIVDKALLEKTINAFEEQAKSKDEDALDIYEKIARTYNNLLKWPDENSLIYWNTAMKITLDSISENAEKADWGFYLELIFTPIDREKSGQDFAEIIIPIEEQQKEARENLHSFLKNHFDKNHDLAIPFILGFKSLKSHLEWRKMELDLFPNEEYLFWLENGLEFDPEKITRIELMEIAHFFINQGTELQRVDSLKQGIRLFSKFLDRIDDCAFEIYYIASAWQTISRMYTTQENKILADEALQNAIDIYESHIDIINTNPSTFMHYSEFLEDCYLYKGNIQKPSLEKLNQVAIQVEEEGQGHYGTPFYLRMRLALYVNNEQEAIYHLTKALICHELCHNKDVDQFLIDFKEFPFARFYSFLEETKEFMIKAEENYYLDTELKWEDLKTMPPNEVSDYWEKRKIEILNREKLDFSE